MRLVDEMLVYAKQLGGSSICVLAVKSQSEERIKLINDLLKPAVIEKSIFANYKSTSIEIQTTDLKIIKNLLLNPRLQIEDIKIHIIIYEDYCKMV